MADYGRKKYGENLYAADADKLPENAGIRYRGRGSFVDISHYAPDFIAQIPDMAAAYKAQGYAIGQAKYLIDLMEAQGYLGSADIGLTRWEELYGITGVEGITEEARRGRVERKRKAGHQVTTKDYIKALAKEYFNTEVDVIEDFADYKITIKFVSLYYMPKKIDEFRSAIEMVIPAHIAFEFEHTFTTWGEVKKFKWSEVKTRTWEEVLHGGLK